MKPPTKHQFQAYFKDHIRTQDDAIKFLQDVGIFDGDGKLREIYKKHITEEVIIKKPGVDTYA